MRKQFKEAIDVLTKATVTYPSFYPILTQKARIHIMAGEWDQAYETCQRPLQTDPYNTDALVLSALYLLVRKSAYEISLRSVKDLVSSVEKFEKSNHTLLYELSKVFTCLSFGNSL